MPSHYLNHCWNIVNWTLGNKLQWNFNRNSNIFIKENTFENVVCEMASICLNVLRQYMQACLSMVVILVTLFSKIVFLNIHNIIPSLSFTIRFRSAYIQWSFRISCHRDMCTGVHSTKKSTLDQVMAWCRQATSHYLIQCWPRSLRLNHIELKLHIMCI